jgi:hypothetical protein
MVAVGLAAAPAIADSPPQPDPVPISAVTQTRVTKGCVITPQQLILASDNGGQEVSWNDDFSTKRKVRGDSVTFVVPTENTRGMSFMIQPPEEGSGPGINANPVIVFQYAGYEPGEWVERSQAVKASSGSPCWAGTTDDKVSLDVNVRKVRVEGIKMVGDQPTGGPTPVRVPLAWVAPTEAAFGGFTSTDRGVVAAQDVYPCGGPS